MKYLFFLSPFLTLFAAPLLVLAQEDRLTFIEQLPFMNGAVSSTEDYISALYMIAISVAAILVVIRLMLAGAKYMLSEVVTNKGQAKEDIKGALLGLIIVLGAVTILNTINPQLTRTDIFRNAEVATPPGASSNSNSAPVQQNTRTGNCTGGPIWMECETSTSIDSQCSAANNTSWCTGTITTFP